MSSVRNIVFRNPLISQTNAFLKGTRNFSSSAADYDVVVIGSGPGGYVAAIKASQLGLKTACVEKRATLGGTCLNVGCIPSKALLNASHQFHHAKNGLKKYGITADNVQIDVAAMQSAKDRSVKSLTSGIEMLFKKNKVDWIKGFAKFKSPNTLAVTDGVSEKTVSAKNVVIATGSEVKPFPGVEIDEIDVLSSTGALSLTEIPKRLVVVGAGVIGLEMGSVWSRLGSKVTVVEFLDRIAPGMDNEVAMEFTKILKKQGMEFHFQTGLQMVEKTKSGLKLTVKRKNVEKEVVLECDKVLIATGRYAFMDGLDLDKAGVIVENGIIKTDNTLRTSAENVYAIGDVTDGPQLAHKAEEEGIAVAEIIANRPAHINYAAIPKVVYTNPEVASVGKSEEELKTAKIEYSVGKFPFLANSRAKTVDDYEGFVKVLAEKETNKILGVHIIGEQAGDLIQEAVLAMNYGGSAEDVARTCHAHPTRSEAIKEAMMAAYDKPIHF